MERYREREDEKSFSLPFLTFLTSRPLSVPISSVLPYSRTHTVSTNICLLFNGEQMKRLHVPMLRDAGSQACHGASSRLTVGSLDPRLRRLWSLRGQISVLSELQNCLHLSQGRRRDYEVPVLSISFNFFIFEDLIFKLSHSFYSFIHHVSLPEQGGFNQRCT